MKCRVCDSENLKLAIDLGSQPWGNNFLRKDEVGKETYYPLRVVFCDDCRAVQLDYTVKKEVMFGDHTYLSGTTKTLDQHFKKLAEEVDSRFFKDAKGKSAFDIGSNDGTQLKHYLNLGYDVLGVESSVRIAAIANESGCPTLNTFFNLGVARSLGRKFKVINASGIFFHLEELHSVTDGIKELLDEDGVFVVQFIYVKTMVENMAFDQIYHEHLLYYTLRTVEVLLKRHGLSMFDAYLSPIHGGSIIGFVAHDGKAEKSGRLRSMLEDEERLCINEFSTYAEFSKKIWAHKEKTLADLGEAKKNGKRIYGMGAPVKGNTLLNTFCIGTAYIDFLVEKNPMRGGLYSPGMHIPVVLERDVKELPDIYFVLAWNFKREILENNGALIEKGVEFYFPIDPEV